MTDMNINANPGVKKIVKSDTPETKEALKAEVEKSIFEAKTKLNELKNEAKKELTKENTGKLVREGSRIVGAKLAKVKEMLGELKDVAFKEVKKVVIDGIEKEKTEVEKKLESNVHEKKLETVKDDGAKNLDIKKLN